MAKAPAHYVSPYAPVIAEQESTELLVTLPGGKEITLSRQLRNGKATFDISGILRSLFENREELDPAPEAPRVVLTTDYQLVTPPVSIKSENITATVEALRTLPKRGKKNDLTEWDNPDLLLVGVQFSGSAKLKRFKGYPLSVSILTPQDIVVVYTISFTDGEDQAFTRLLSGTIVMDCKDISSIDSSYGYTIDIADSCMPDSPLYVRWINSLGGWEYHMFGGAKGIGRRTEKGDTFKYAEADDPEAIQTDGELAPTVEDYITCGEEQLDEQEFFTLREIASSPLVQVYDVDRKLFTRCLVRNSDIVWDTRTTRGQINLELMLMSPYTQF